MTRTLTPADLDPGKSEAAATGLDSNDDENRAQCDAWHTSGRLAAYDAIMGVARLLDQLRRVEEAMEVVARERGDAVCERDRWQPAEDAEREAEARAEARSDTADAVAAGRRRRDPDCR